MRNGTARNCIRNNHAFQDNSNMTLLSEKKFSKECVRVCVKVILVVIMIMMKMKMKMKMRKMLMMMIMMTSISMFRRRARWKTFRSFS